MTADLSTARATTVVRMIALLGLGVGVAALSSCTPAESADPVIQKGRDAVLLHYIVSANWGPIGCEEGTYRGSEFIYCHPSGDPVIGGLHLIAKANGEPVIHPINGTAMGKLKADWIRAVDTSPVEVRPWDGGLFDISEIIETLQ